MVICFTYVSGVELESCDLLREGAPIEPVPPVTHWKPEAAVSAKHKVSEGIITHLKSKFKSMSLCVEFLLMTQLITEHTANVTAGVQKPQ